MDQQSIKEIEKQLEKELKEDYEGRPEHLRRLITYEKLDKGLINLFVNSDDTESEIPNLKPLETMESLTSIYVGNVQQDKKIFSSFCLMKLIQNQQNSLQRVLVIGEQKNDAEKWKNELTSLIHGQVGTNQVKGKGKSKKIKENPDTVETTNPEEILNHFLIAPQISKSHIGLKPEIAPFLGVSYYSKLSFDFQGNEEEASVYDTNAEFIRFLKQQVATKDFTLFDLVVIDFNILPKSKKKEDKNKLELIRHLKQNSKNVLIIASEAIQKDQIQALLKEFKIPLKTTISSISSNLILISDLSLLDRNQIIINEDREKNCEYLESFIKDALPEPEIAKNQFERDDSDTAIWKLRFASEDIHGKIKEFIGKFHIKTKYILYNPTLLSSQAEVTCLFNIKQINQVKERYEIIDSNHPIILWIKDKCFQNSSLLKRRSAIKLSLQKAKPIIDSIKSGEYFYCISCSSVSGLVEKYALHYQVYALSSEIDFNEEESKKLIEKAAVEGEFFPNAINNVKQPKKIADFFKKCQDNFYSPSLEEKDVLYEQQKKQLQQEKEKVINDVKVNIKRMSEILPNSINDPLKGVYDKYDKKDKELNEVMQSTNAENAIIGIGLILVEEEE